MHATGFLRGYRLPDTIYYTAFTWRSLTIGTIFFLVFNAEKSFPTFWYTLPIHALSRTKNVCLHYLREYKLCRCARTTTLEAGDAATRIAAMCSCQAQYSWYSLPPRFSRACAYHVYTHVRTYVPRFRSINALLWYLPRHHRDFSCSKHYLFWDKRWRQFGNNVLPSFILSTSPFIETRRITGEEFK